MKLQAPCNFSDTTSVFGAIANLQEAVATTSDEEIIIELQNSEILHNTRMFLLSCLSAFGKQYEKNIKYFIKLSSTTESVELPILKKSGDVVNMVTQNISHNLPIQATNELVEILCSLTAEIFNNAKEHSEAKYIVGGCYNLLQSGRKKLCFCCYDTGIGIIESVRNFLKLDSDPRFRVYKADEYLLRWALQKGNSTKYTKELPRGAGLDWLLDFAGVNGGYIRICSEDVLFEQNSQRSQKFCALNKSFQGTFFEMGIKEDPNFVYKLKGEGL